MTRSFSRTKIVATVGPACSSEEVLLELMKAGVNVFRLNFSHGGQEDKQAIIDRVRKLNSDHGFTTALLADLQGPKIRLGRMANGPVQLIAGQTLQITTKQDLGTSSRLSISYDAFARDVRPGDTVLIDDGKLELKVMSTNRVDTAVLEVVHGGEVLENKGVNFPDTEVSTESLTEKDKADLDFIVENDFDWVALSFVRTSLDIRALKEFMKERGKAIKTIAKIEKPQAVRKIDEIIREADGVMIARGDLGVELPMETVPMVQKSIVEKCIRAARPVIIATQMMESMIESARPTRAEVTDVANAVLDGADAVMLSAETAVGQHPVLVVKTMQKVLASIEKEHSIYGKDLLPDEDSPTYLSDAICYNAAEVAGDVNARAIVGMTRSGYTAFMCSSYRPRARIFIFSDNPKIINVLSLVWGVQCFHYDRMVSTDDSITDVNKLLKDKGLVREGDIVINTVSAPLHRQGRTNTIRISKVD
jgi:pyruvate kinase